MSEEAVAVVRALEAIEQRLARLEQVAQLTSAIVASSILSAERLDQVDPRARPVLEHMLDQLGGAWRPSEAA